ncbi:hypothetical protein Bca4012_010978 [Brassica carinata]
MTDPSNTTPIDASITQTPLNVSETDAMLTNVGTIAATTTTTLPVGNSADETTRRSLFGAGLYQTASIEGTSNAPVAVSTPPIVPSVFTQGLMPDKFDGKGFKMWRKKMLFFRQH